MGTLLAGVNNLSANVVSPNPGEKVRAAAGMAGSIRDPLQALLDRQTAVRMGLYGYVGHRGSIWDAAAADETVFDAPGAFVVTSGGEWVVIPAVDPIAIAAWGAMDSDGNAFTADTRYWVYLYDDAGAPGVWIVPEAPGPSGLYMDDGAGADDTDYVLLSTAVYNSAASAFIDQTQAEKRFYYTNIVTRGGGDKDNLILDQGNAVFQTNVSFNNLIPAIAKTWGLRYFVDNGGGGARYNYRIGQPGFTFFDNWLVLGSVINGNIFMSYVPAAWPDPAAGVDYDVSNTGMNLSIWVADYSL